jgi:riboflavin biosynthesis pyrimidine reductase
VSRDKRAPLTTAVSVDPGRPEPIEFPPPPPGRPWTFGNVIASANGIVSWARGDGAGDPIDAIAGGDLGRPGRRADVELMRRLRARADAVAFGAQTLRDQPDLIGAVDDLGGPLGEALRVERAREGKPPVPAQVVYTASGQVDLRAPIFGAVGVKAIVVTTAAGAGRLRAAGSEDRGVSLVVAGDERVEPGGLVLAHRRLLEEFGIRRIDCEGGVILLGSLREARLLDELFVTVSDVEVDPVAHAGVRRLPTLAPDAADLVAEARLASDPGYRFQRWRFR